MAIETVGSVGAGIMGNGIAQVAAVTMLKVVMIDLETLVAKEEIDAATRDVALARIETSMP